MIRTRETTSEHAASGAAARILFLLVAALMFSASLSGCGDGGNKSKPTGTKTDKPSQKKLVIAVIPKDTTQDFWKSVHMGAAKAKKAVGVKMSVRGPAKEDDLQAQVSIVESVVTSGVSGIVLAPIDATALQPSVAAAKKAGIPVVIIDSELKGNDYVSFIATDHLKAGRAGGEHLAELLGGKGKVIMLRYLKTSASTMQRETGFMQAMETNTAIQVVSSTEYGGATADSAFQASKNLLASLTQGGKLTVDGIFCPNESTTAGMLQALQSAKLAGAVRLVGFGNSQKLVDALAAGEVDGLVLQNPIRMGNLAVKTLVAHIRGEQVEKTIDAGVALATRKNMAQEAISKILKPDLAKLSD